MFCAKIGHGCASFSRMPVFSSRHQREERDVEEDGAPVQLLHDLSKLAS